MCRSLSSKRRAATVGAHADELDAVERRILPTLRRLPPFRAVSRRLRHHAESAGCRFVVADRPCDPLNPVRHAWCWLDLCSNLWSRGPRAFRAIPAKTRFGLLGPSGGVACARLLTTQARALHLGHPTRRDRSAFVRHGSLTISFTKISLLGRTHAQVGCESHASPHDSPRPHALEHHYANPRRLHRPPAHAPRDP